VRVKRRGLDITPIEVLVIELRDDEMDWAFHYTTGEDVFFLLRSK
jgi:hypothetical protein